MMQTVKEPVYVLALGGTIDSVERTWPMPKEKRLVKMLDESLVGKFVKKLGQNLEMHGYKNVSDIVFEQNEKFADSSLFDDTDIEKVANKIRNKGIKNVIVTFGTDFMPDLAEKLNKLLKEDGFTIQVTGAMTPLANGVQRNDEWDITDGFENIEYALQNFEKHKLKPGTYLSFHHETFSAGYVKKDFEQGVFLKKGDFYKKYTHEAQGIKAVRNKIRPSIEYSGKKTYLERLTSFVKHSFDNKER